MAQLSRSVFTRLKTLLRNWVKAIADDPAQAFPGHRSSLANWVGGACWWLEPLQQKLADHVFVSQKLFADDTPIPVLDPGRGRSKTGRLWVYARDELPWSGSDPPAVIYLYSPVQIAVRP